MKNFKEGKIIKFDEAFEIVMDSVSKDFFINKGFDPVFGARPLKRTIQRFLEDPLSEAIIRGDFADKLKEGQIVQVKVKRKGESLLFG